MIMSMYIIWYRCDDVGGDDSDGWDDDDDDDGGSDDDDAFDNVDNGNFNK